LARGQQAGSQELLVKVAEVDAKVHLWQMMCTSHISVCPKSDKVPRGHFWPE